MIRFSENHKRTVLRTRFHAPDFESRSHGRARREKDRSFIDLNLATPAIAKREKAVRDAQSEKADPPSILCRARN
jgi:hypothetical protein